MIDLSLDYIKTLVNRALEEDIGKGDITTSVLIPPGARCCASLIFKEKGIIAGMGFANVTFETLDPDVKYIPYARDGGLVEKGQVVAVWEGKAASLLTGERTALNFVQHLSGIATNVFRLTKIFEGNKTVLLDTRKTIPGLRLAEKYAVSLGGGINHRIGLYDGILIKNNHLVFYPNIADAVKKAKNGAPDGMKIEVEIRRLEEIAPAIEAGVDVILLDNMNDRMIRKALEIIDGRVPVEVSGGITRERLFTLKKVGVDFISMGSITHSSKALDAHILMEPVKSKE
ncbi:MAG: carboxylating nicotinate-nucleotide diphosphorylase [Candidatus Eremiobacteraeota bacterium]|nr:carboxylating nicotinate-nucleotide diphosphorylase [Candidatus Eremiobacteraeota bacterium]